MDLDFLFQLKAISRFLSKHSPTEEGRRKHRALARNYGARIARAKRSKPGAGAA
jgi:hypothetical protein